jgi:TetR/AcrR family transcriptional regulator, regulator of mycofactocin system
MTSAGARAAAGSAGEISGATAVMRQILAHGARIVHSAGVTAQDGAPKGAGRPPATTREDIERVAFALFARSGFEETTVEDIAAAAGIGRRTFFRYFASKNDVVWGEFDAGLGHLRTVLDGADPEGSWMADLRGAVIDFNSLDPAQVPLHRDRMELILHVPALQAYATLMYARWREVVSEFVAARTGAKPDDFLPRLVGHTTLAAAVAAYEQWLAEPDTSLGDLLDGAMRWLTGEDRPHE